MNLFRLIKEKLSTSTAAKQAIKAEIYELVDGKLVRKIYNKETDTWEVV